MVATDGAQGLGGKQIDISMRILSGRTERNVSDSCVGSILPELFVVVKSPKLWSEIIVQNTTALFIVLNEGKADIMKAVSIFLIIVISLVQNNNTGLFTQRS